MKLKVKKQLLKARTEVVVNETNSTKAVCKKQTAAKVCEGRLGAIHNLSTEGTYCLVKTRVANQSDFSNGGTG